jgi:HSPB1-associated protein 1
MDLATTEVDDVKLLKGAASSWGGEEFYLRLRNELKETVTVFRACSVGVKSAKACDGVNFSASFSQFFEWFDGSVEMVADNPFRNLPPRERNALFVYADYKHFIELFEEQVPWGQWSDVIPDTKLDSVNGNTLWLGTVGAHTPLHYDTYNCNYVAQLFGRKRWLIWKNKDKKATGTPGPRSNRRWGHDLSPTRVPYEESSIFAAEDPMNYVNGGIGCPTPDFDIILEPGDVLYIPKHYWHFVITLDAISLSVNRWCSVPSDNIDRVSEAIVRIIHRSVMESLNNIGITTDNPSDGWICPSEVSDEDDGYFEEQLDNLKYLVTAVTGARRFVGGHGEETLGAKDILKTVVSELLNPQHVDRCVAKLIGKGES